MADKTLSTLSAGRLIEYIARGHAFDKHVMGFDTRLGMHGVNAFRSSHTKPYFDPSKQQLVPPQPLGNDLCIETPDDLADYIKQHFLTSPFTRGYITPENGGVNIYNTRDNVALHFSWNNKQYDFGTAYRYPQTQARFERGQAASMGDTNGIVPFKSFDNASDPNATMNALNAMITDISARPGLYLLNKNNPASTVQNTILGHASRPGRTWNHDEVLNAPHNIRGHSRTYAKAHGMDIPEAEFVRVEQEMESEFNVGRVSKSMRSQKIASMLIVGPEAIQSLKPSANADSEQEIEATIESS